MSSWSCLSKSCFVVELCRLGLLTNLFLKTFFFQFFFFALVQRLGLVSDFKFDDVFFSCYLWYSDLDWIFCIEVFVDVDIFIFQISMSVSRIRTRFAISVTPSFSSTPISTETLFSLHLKFNCLILAVDRRGQSRTLGNVYIRIRSISVHCSFYCVSKWIWFFET